MEVEEEEDDFIEEPPVERLSPATPLELAVPTLRPFEVDLDPSLELPTNPFDSADPSIGCREPGIGQGASFGSYRAFTERVGPAGEDLEWHHIVEQTPGNKVRFGQPSIQNTGNSIRLDYGVHRQISGFYSSVQPFSSPLTVRQWLAPQPFNEQQDFGIQILLQFGVSF